MYIYMCTTYIQWSKSLTGEFTPGNRQLRIHAVARCKLSVAAMLMSMVSAKLGASYTQWNPHT